MSKYFFTVVENDAELSEVAKRVEKVFVDFADGAERDGEKMTEAAARIVASAEAKIKG